MHRYIVIAVALAALCAPVAARAGEALERIQRRHGLSMSQATTWDKGGDHIKLQFSEELRFADLMDRIYTLMTSDEYFGGKYPEVRQAAQLIKQMGCFDLAATSCSYQMDNDFISFASATRYDGLDPDSIQGRTFALEDKRPASAEYMLDNSYLLYFTMNHVPQRMKIALEEMQESDAAASEMAGEESIMDSVLAEMGIEDVDEILKVLRMLESEQGAFGVKLSGELAGAVFGLPGVDAMTSDNFNPQPGDFDVVAMLGLNGSEGVGSALAGFGAMAGLVPGASPAPGWERYDMAGTPGVGLVYNDEIIIGATNLDKAWARIAEADRTGGINVGPCQYYYSANVARLHDGWVKPGVDLALNELASENPELYRPEASAAFLLALPDSAKLGELDIIGYHNQGYRVEGEMSSALFTYGLYYLGIASCIAAQSDVASAAIEELNGALEGMEAVPDAGTLEVPADDEAASDDDDDDDDDNDDEDDDDADDDDDEDDDEDQ